MFMVCQWLAAGQWFSMGTLVSSINKTDCHDIAEILLKFALNIIIITLSFQDEFHLMCWMNCLFKMSFIICAEWIVFSRWVSSHVLNELSFQDEFHLMCWMNCLFKMSFISCAEWIVFSRWVSSHILNELSFQDEFHLIVLNELSFQDEFHLMSWMNCLFKMSFISCPEWIACHLMIGNSQ
jgi:uncharacterized membrane protein YciS (DUF1049 family)